MSAPHVLLDHLLNVTFAQPPTVKPRVMAELNRILAGANLPEFCIIQRNSLASKTDPQKDAIMSQLIDKSSEASHSRGVHCAGQAYND